MKISSFPPLSCNLIDLINSMVLYLFLLSVYFVSQSCFIGPKQWCLQQAEVPLLRLFDRKRKCWIRTSVEKCFGREFVLKTGKWVVLTPRAGDLGLAEGRRNSLWGCVLLSNRCVQLAIAQRIYRNLIRKMSQKATDSGSWWWFLTLHWILHNNLARRQNQLWGGWSHICFHTQERGLCTELQ